MIQLTVELRMYWMFIYFQAEVPLEELDVKRREFNNQERRFQKYRKIFLYTMLVISFVLIVVGLCANNKAEEFGWLEVANLFWVCVLAYFV